MCSVGKGDFNLEIEHLKVERYKCNDCGKKFDVLGGLPCSYCDECLPERADVQLNYAVKRFCAHQDRMQPSVKD